MQLAKSFVTTDACGNAAFGGRRARVQPFLSTEITWECSYIHGHHSGSRVCSSIYAGPGNGDSQHISSPDHTPHIPKKTSRYMHPNNILVHVTVSDYHSELFWIWGSIIWHFIESIPIFFRRASEASVRDFSPKYRQRCFNEFNLFLVEHIQVSIRVKRRRD